VRYRITKDCGVGWDDARAAAITAWGVSERQRLSAGKLAIGDVLLHYIDHAHAWAGYSRVVGALRPNDRDAQPDWRAALPYVVIIEPGVWLSAGQCEQTVVVRGLPNKHYQRQVAFTGIPDAEATLIVAAIDAAAMTQREPTSDFDSRWREGAAAYFKAIVKRLANGRCMLCGSDAEGWVARLPFTPAECELARVREAFLDAAHIVPDSQTGPLAPDNLRPLCPNCHRIVDRLSQERRETLLRDWQGQRSSEGQP
jgi:hypothetical protein